MEIAQLRALALAVELGSLRAAAKQLELTPPTVLRALSELEKEAGGPVILRGSRGVQPTSLGRMVLAHGRLILDQERRLKDDLQRRGLGARLIRVAAAEAPAKLLLPQAIREMRARGMSAQVRVAHGGYMLHSDKIRQGDIDLMISPMPEVFQAGDLKVTPLYRNRSVLITSLHNDIRHVHTLGDLQTAPWIVISPGPHGPGASALEAFEAAGLEPPQDVIRCEMNSLTLELVRGLDGFALVPLPLLPADLKAAGLQRVPLDLGHTGHEVYLIERHDLIETPEIALFIELIKKQGPHAELALSANHGLA